MAGKNIGATAIALIAETYPGERPGPRSPQSEAQALTTPHGYSELLRYSTQGRWQSLRLAGSTQALQLSRSAIEFMLTKLTETVIPVSLHISVNNHYRVYNGPIHAIECSDRQLRITGTQDMPCIAVSPIDSGWLISRPRADGEVTKLELFDANNQRLAQLCGLRSQCIAWRALTQWLLLRELQPQAAVVQSESTTGHGHEYH